MVVEIILTLWMRICRFTLEVRTIDPGKIPQKIHHRLSHNFSFSRTLHLTHYTHSKYTR